MKLYFVGLSYAVVHHKEFAGTGTFGRVRLALHKTSKAYYALKIMKKAEVRGALRLLQCGKKQKCYADNSQEASGSYQE